MKIQRLLMNLRGGLPGQLVTERFALLPLRAGIVSHYLRRLNLCRHSCIYIPGRRLSSRVVIPCSGIHDLVEDEWDGKNSGANLKDEFDALLVCKKYPSIIIGSSPTIELYDGTTSFSPTATESCWGFPHDAVDANWGVPSRLCNTWSSLSVSLEEEKSPSQLPMEESVASLLPNEPMPVEIGWLDRSVVEEESSDKVKAETDLVAATVEMILDRPISSLPGLTKRQCHLLEKNDFHTIRKMLNHFPRTYADLQNAHIGIQDGQYLISVGRILSSRGIRAGCSFSFLEVVVGCEIADDKSTWEHMDGDLDAKEKKTIYLHLKKFFRGTRFTSQSFLRILQEKHRVGDIVCVSGKVKSMSSEDHYEIREYNIDVLEDEEDSSLCTAGRPYPIYPSKGGLNPTFIRDVIQRALQTLSFGMDPIPKDVTQELGILCLRDAYMGIHQPKNIYEADSARKRLIFDEFFYLQLGRLFQMLEGLGTEIEKVGLLDKYRKPEMSSTYIEEWSSLTKKFLKTLPYDLTTSQLSAVSEIISDLKRPVPMNRLLQGDVGCGKTVVAFLACMEVIGSGYQAAFMVPTELLAIQHHEHLLNLLEKLDIESRPSIALLTGATPSKQSRVIREGLQAGEISMVIGTHSLIAERIEFSALRIAVVDEQHRFGVVQRGRFNSKLYYNSASSRTAAAHLDDPSRGDANMAPHVLAMSATPIPRTLALALYGDMSMTQITDLPPGRIPVETHVIEGNEQGFQEMYKMMFDELEDGGKIYLVYPVIEQSEQLPQLRAASADLEDISQRFKDYNCGLLHGKMKSDEKEEALRRFRSGDTNILLSTQVIEIGVDVPDASMMVVMNAERFGMAQLHQLRGRVGRGARKSRCILLASTASSLIRLKVLENSTDGFHLANMDLLLRGPGDLLGKRQSGHLPEFPIARLEIDGNILQDAHHAVLKVLGSSHDLERFPGLKVELSMRQPLSPLGD
ncbi:ATP-dependent DNA helicase homolog RECG, chloroplastic [Syzygium oleosum]|uniref:ATP-dependent DNA helicase homolog RECG, chloroplastic n=1 Tax=Syzygium oleosum TaxID=219896 RepID=UPI0011D285C3|nr:ATP-dependent DNA helicase homolog RECG, chloroplastic [Syzygium oleosum]XP_056164363.1 ATP-dependent DNA helicase homolog RECG, chloroplastic [Syzygium oleosum]XP_056164364.1 ATP-dependent DNA helicase homolog RECG, chloroplastic [Syzygium oleosum]